MSRIVVLTGTMSYSVRKGIVALLDDVARSELLVVIHRPPRRVARLVRSQWRNLKRHGWRWIPYQTTDLIQRIVAGVRAHGEHRRGGSLRDYSLAAIERRVQVVYSANLVDRSTLESIGQFKPDIGVSLAAPILPQAVFALPRLGTLNLHKGRVPDYRGMPPAFWELWHGENEVGCTIHTVEAGLDTGPVISQSSIPVQRFSTLKGLQYTLDELGVRLMTNAVTAVLAGTAQPMPQRPGGNTFRKPTLLQESALRQRMAQQSGNSLRGLVKDAVFRGYAGIAAPVRRRLRAWRDNPRVVVLLYHRVNDAMRDSLTVGIEQFDQQMALLARRCRVVDIRDVVAGHVERDTALPIVAVTFDDGYVDNYSNAFPILLRNSVSAGFFVSTGKIDVDGAFDHDLSRIGHGLPTMTWAHLHEMHDAGFAIGSHSVSHLDCGKSDLEQVRSELRESRDTLKERLGIAKAIFAYPFGGRQNMTPKALEVVRQEGYAGCLSAYGECNDGPIDPFNVRRIGINHNFNEWSFRARLEGWC